MKTLRNLSASAILALGLMSCPSTIGAPPQPQSQDSLAIVRVVSPIGCKFGHVPAVFVSKGLGRIESVEMRGLHVPEEADAVLDGLRRSGFKVQNTTEATDHGLQLNTFYLKKRAI